MSDTGAGGDTRLVWLARNGSGMFGQAAPYVVGPLKSQPMDNRWFNDLRPNAVCWEQLSDSGDAREITLCPGDFERLFPRMKLEPGAKPRLVEISIREVSA